MSIPSTSDGGMKETCYDVATRFFSAHRAKKVLKFVTLS